MAPAKTLPRPPTKVALFVTCMVDMMYPRVGIAAVELLERCGLEVVFPEGQTCCGQPAFNAGYRAEAVQMADHFLDVFYPLADQGAVDAIVAPSGSCSTMTSHFYAQILEEAGQSARREQAQRLAAITFELTEFLVDVLNVRRLPCRYPGKVTYHACCHLLREMQVDAQPRQLLAHSDLDFVEMEGRAECCGFGGLFAVKNEPISTAMGNAKLDYIEASGADAAVMCDVSCMTHLQGLMQRQGRNCRAVHIAEVLASHTDAAGSAGPDAAPEPTADADGAPRPRRWQDFATD